MISTPDRIQAVRLIDETVTAGSGLKAACQEIGLTDRTYFRWKKLRERTGRYDDLRPTAAHPTPANKLTVEEEEKILEIIKQAEFVDLPPCEIVPILADRGKYIASESTFYRVMHKYEMQHHRGRTQERKPRPLSTHYATAPNRVWMWDITYLNGPIKGKFYYLYLISDLYSRKIVGWEVWPEESAEHASELIKRTIIAEKITPPMAQPLVLHSDNGSPMKGATMLETLYKLGITPSNSRPRVSNDNPYAESLFKTLKYRCNYQPKGFKSLTEARLWCKKFEIWYNTEHHHSGINYLTPNQRHCGEGKAILSKRHEVYQQAKAANPTRWSRTSRDWSLEDKVWLNPEKEPIVNIYKEAGLVS